MKRSKLIITTFLLTIAILTSCGVIDKGKEGSKTQEDTAATSEEAIMTEASEEETTAAGMSS